MKSNRDLGYDRPILNFSLYIGKWLLTHDGLFRLNNHESVNKKYRWSQWDKVTMGYPPRRGVPRRTGKLPPRSQSPGGLDRRLIAQAPAMLQALRDIVDAYTLECNPTEVQRRINVAVELIRSIEMRAKDPTTH